MTDDTVVGRYKEAYRAENGKRCPYSFVYKNGWYRMYDSGYLCKCARRASIVDWTARLEQRTKQRLLSTVNLLK